MNKGLKREAKTQKRSNTKLQEGENKITVPRTTQVESEDGVGCRLAVLGRLLIWKKVGVFFARCALHGFPTTSGMEASLPLLPVVPLVWMHCREEQQMESAKKNKQRIRKADAKM